VLNCCPPRPMQWWLLTYAAAGSPDS
jgi:hypothetical protein